MLTPSEDRDTDGMTGERKKPAIVVGIDGSPSSADAVRWALDYARLVGGTVRAVYAWSPPAVASVGLPMMTIDWSTLREEAEEFPAQFIASVVDPDVDWQVNVIPIMKAGSAAQVLVDESDHADLLVVGSRGDGGLRGMMLGSVSHHCAAHSYCPVVIVRPVHHKEKRTVHRDRLSATT